MTDDFGSAWFQRRLEFLKKQKESIARQVLNHNLICEGDEVFFSSGTTCFYVADLAQKQIKNLKIETNSIFVASHLATSGFHNGQLSVTVPAGSIDLRSGMIEHISAAVKPSPVRKLFLTTRGVSKQGLSCLYNKEQIKAIISKHSEVVVLSTFEKVGEVQSHRVKGIGQIGSELRSGRRRFTIVLPEWNSEVLGQERRAEIEKIKGYYENEGVRMITSD